MADTTPNNATETTRQEARTLTDEIIEKGSEAAKAATETARGYAERARDEAYARGEEYRAYAADETGRLASALRRASEDLSSGSPQERFVGQLADGVAEAAERVRGMSLDDIARDATDFAKRHPAAFLGGAALLGFAAARFMKATARDETLYLPRESASRQRAGATGAPDQNRGKSAASDISGPNARSKPTTNAPGQSASKSPATDAPGQNWNKATSAEPGQGVSKSASAEPGQGGGKSATDAPAQTGNKSAASDAPGQS